MNQKQKVRKARKEDQPTGVPVERVVDYRTSEIGRQNWEVCSRMLVHDLLQLAGEDPRLKEILNFYSIHYTPDGAYTMALPRMGVLQLRGLKVSKA